MSSECNNNCASCSESCSERTQEQTDFRVAPNKMSHIKKVVGVVSGKGGVGKSFVTSMLAVMMQRKGYRTAVLDADVTGPSIPQAFGIKNRAVGTEEGIMPINSTTGISIMSLNLLLENDTDPVVWRGPIIANVVKQFWTDVVWGDVDYMFVDMPPGTGDVPLTVFQSLPVDGLVVVASPQELVGMIVEKAVNMANMMDIPVLALVENMSYYKCPDCGHEHHIFGESHIGEIGEKFGIETVCRIPLNPSVSAAADAGKIEMLEEQALEPVIALIEKV